MNKRGLAAIGHVKDIRRTVIKLQIIGYLSLLALIISLICNLIAVI
ncbi:hypothetical protein [Candidatus Enterococcus clewellii]|uniref:Uncharacterized protein n=1 Tax=Candidatus Enterococcus clewellii TaxID=1834193 RepID=A0A242K8H2_9ENTE|nr:hypothetical protein [Enterococcus sp. 9E7_DIV0242]OTP17256.1 hypothetical protein A5888_001394 [Enterococcus sp. 9E7_DIV0242]